jgi:RNA polymerase sigma-70 factor (ECF subfamily)
MAEENIAYLNHPAAEERLCQGLRAGQEDCYRHLYEIYAPRLRRMLERIWRDPQLAHDALQSTFLIVFRRIHQFDGRSSLLTWMTRIALREAGRMTRRSRVIIDGRELAALAENRPSPEDRYGTLEQVEKLRQLVDQLPDAKRSALVLFEIEEMSVGEIADVMEEPRGTILARLSRTRAELREAMQAFRESAVDQARRPGHE